MRRALVGLIPLFLVCLPLHAQTVRGAVVERTTDRSVGTGFVVVLGADSAELGRVLTNVRGQFTLRLPGAGTYYFRSERIGFMATTVGPLELAAGQLAELVLRVDPLPVNLSRIQVSAVDQCHMRTDDAANTLALWDEARKVLTATLWVSQRNLYRYSTVSYERDLDEMARAVSNERIQTETGLRRTPFRSLPPSRLERVGYIVESDSGNVFYYSADPAVLLHESFQRTHCFSVVRESGAPGLVGLGFRPVSGRDVADIRGALWLDEVTGALVSLGYVYTGVPHGVGDDRVGGYVDFLGLPDGTWVVKEWRIRMPAIAVRLTATERQPRLVGYRDSGSEVTEIRNSSGGLVYSSEGAVLVGTVFDSTQGRPLFRARVGLAGTEVSAATDGLGRFRLTGPFEGVYRVTVDHPRLDSLGYQYPGFRIVLSRGVTVGIDIGIPSLEGIFAGVCEDVPFESDRRAIVGVVRDGSGNPATGARIVAAWRDVQVQGNTLRTEDRELVAVADADGRYELCGIGPIQGGKRITLFARTDDQFSPTERITLDPNGIQLADGPFIRSDSRVWGRDLRLTETGASGAISGTVINALSGDGVMQAVVEIAGFGMTATTDANGNFEFDAVPRGMHLLIVRHVGYRQLVYEVTVPAGAMAQIPPGHLVISQAVAVMDTIAVMGRSLSNIGMAGFRERMEAGLGHFMTLQQIVDRNPSVATDMLRHAGGLRIRSNPNYGTGDTRRFVIESTRALPGFGASSECPPLIFFDGLYMGNAQSNDVDDIIPINMVQAIEVYQGPSQTPAQFNRAGADCGVIVFWTRGGEMGAGR